MSDKTTPSILLQSSPHIASPVNTKMLMGTMMLSLMPVSIYGIIIFGLPALINILVAIVSAVAGESLFRLATKQPIRARDLSAGISGLLLALVIPPSTPYWMTALGAVFAVVVGKEFFGGLGANVFNPALIGRAFLVMSFPAALTTWRLPCQPFLMTDAITGATPLGITKMGEGISAVGKSLFDAGLSASPSFWDTIRTLFFGFNAGCIGETSVFLILAAFLFLLVTKTIDWRTPLCMIGAGFLAALAFWQDVPFALYSILTGGLFFGAVFMVTDYVTAPVTGKGKIIFGTGVGLIAMLIRRWGIYPEGVCFAILIMNSTTPFLNKLLSKKYGAVKKVSDKPKTNLSGMAKLGVILAIFAAAACVMLAFVYSGTSTIISQRQEADLDAALKELFPEADSFKKVDGIICPDASVTIESAYAAIKKGLPYGAALRLSRASYGGPIKTMVGVSSDGLITGVKIMEHSDTPGLGANAASKSYFVDRERGLTFYGQFTGKKVTDRFAVKDDVIAITASTVTSAAVAASVKAAGVAVSAWLEGEKPDIITSATRRQD